MSFSESVPLTVVFSLVVLVSGAYSQKTWVSSGSGGTKTNWSVAANWSPAGVPTASDDVIIATVTGGAKYPELDVPASVRSLTINSGATMECKSYSLTINGGDFTNNGTFLAGTGSVSILGPGASSIAGVPATFNHLIVNNAAGVVLNAPVAVNGNLTLTNGRLTLSSNNLTLGLNAVILGEPFSSSNMIVADMSGEVRKVFSSTGSFTFPIGDDVGLPEYSPVTLNFTSGSFASGATAGVRVVDAVHPNLPGSPIASISRYWVASTSGITGFSCNPDLTYTDDDVVGNELFLELGRWENPGWNIVGSTNFNTNTFTGLNLSSFGDLTGSEASTLPVELTSFSAMFRDGAVQLSWRTETETNNYGFEIQRSTDGNRWDGIGFVPGHGTTNIAHSYAFRDNNLHENIDGFFYRLMQMDRDGTTEYSSIIEVAIQHGISVASVQAYPNPFNPTTVLRYSLPVAAPVTLTIHDMIGRTVVTVFSENEHAQGIHSVALSMHDLPSGTYTAVLNVAGRITTARLLLTR